MTRPEFDKHFRRLFYGIVYALAGGSGIMAAGILVAQSTLAIQVLVGVAVLAVLYALGIAIEDAFR